MSAYIPSFSEILMVSHSCGANCISPYLWNGLIGYWPVVEGGGESVYDMSPNGSHLDFQNMSVSDWAIDANGYAVDLDGVNDELQATKQPPTPLTQVTLWWRGYIEPYVASNDRLLDWIPSPSLFRNSSDKLSWYGDVGGVSRIYNISNDTIVSKNIDIVVTFDGIETIVYIDGIVDAVATTYSGLLASAPTNMLTIGGRSTDNTVCLQSRFDGGAMWDRALSPDEVAELAAQPNILGTLDSSIFVIGSLYANAITLFTNGHLTESNTDTELFTHGHIEVNTFTTLHTVGAETLDGDCSSVSIGGTSITIGSTEITSGCDSTSLSLFMDGLGITNGIGPLYIEGHRNEVNSYISLFVAVDNVASNESNTLYLKNTQTELLINNTNTLYINGNYDSSSDNITLYVMNEGITDSIPLFIKTPPGFTNATPIGSSNTLFINRPDESIAIPLFLKAFDTGSNAFIPLHTRSAITVNTPDLDLSMPNVTSIPINSYMTLAVDGVGTINSGSDPELFIKGVGSETDTIPLFIQQSNVALNTFTTLFIPGVAGILPQSGGTISINTTSISIGSVGVDMTPPPTTITLAMPSVSGFPVDSIPLYVFGW